QCRERAAALRMAYPKHLLSPKTKWIAGWRSRDGELHDYAFTWVNGFACALGLLDRPVAHRALTGLERLRKKVGMDSGTFAEQATTITNGATVEFGLTGGACRLLFDVSQIVIRPAIAVWVDGRGPVRMDLDASGTVELPAARRVRFMANVDSGYLTGIDNWN